MAQQTRVPTNDIGATLPGFPGRGWRGRTGFYAPLVITDATSPTIVIISPTPTGGFPADPTTAANTPIVAKITDANGLRYMCVVARLGAGSAFEEVVYRRGAFRGPYASSSQVVNGPDVTLTIRRSGGWPGSGQVGDVTLELDAIDTNGNLAL